MPKPIAICIEDLDAGATGGRYLRCVALGGPDAGLAVNARGEVLWQQGHEPAAFALVVSLDQRLVLLRPEGAAQVRVSRGGRGLDAPAGKPVVLLDGDRVEVGQRRMRIHVHGEAPAVHAPAPLPAEEPDSSTLGGLARAAATALALGAAVGAAGCKNLEVRERPPTIPAQVIPDKGAKPDLARPDASVARPDQKPIEVRHKPPIVVAPREPPPPKPQPASKKPKAGKQQ